MLREALEGRAPNRKGWVRANCPWCEDRIGKPDRKQCLGFNAISGRWHCFRCGIGGRTDVDEEQVLLFDEEAIKAERVVMEPPESFMPLYEEPGWSSWEGHVPRAYLRGRGIDDDLGFDAGIGACYEGRAKKRVVVPIFAADQKTWMGWSGRAWFPGARQKYLYPTGMDREALLYKHDALLIESDDPVFVVEGVFDALAFWPDAVAVLGKPSEGQIEALIVAKRPVVVALDGDAWREGDALALRLRFEGQRAGALRLPPGKDPDEMVDWVRAEGRKSL
jgi:Toprim-like